MKVKNLTTNEIYEVPSELVKEFNSHTSYWTMKTKGEKHSISKTKTIVAVDPETIEKMDNFTEYACTENRMEQGIMEIYGSIENCKEKDANIGKYLNWVVADIVKEEYDVLEASKEFFRMGEVAGQIKGKAQKYLFSVMDKNVMG